MHKPVSKAKSDYTHKILNDLYERSKVFRLVIVYCIKLLCLIGSVNSPFGDI
jgi:hypothetical protein